MELHAYDRELAMAHGHHLAVVARRAHLEANRNGDGGERVVAARREVSREPVEDSLAVVVDRARLPVDEPARLPHAAAEDLDDRLVSEADAERRRRLGKPQD